MRMMNAISVAITTALMASSYAQDAAPTPTPVKEESANAQTPLPKSLRGRWSNPASGHSDLIEIEVLEMTTPRDGKALVTFWPYCRKSETPVVFERKLKVWRFSAANCSGNILTKSICACAPLRARTAWKVGMAVRATDGLLFGMEIMT